MVNQFKSLEKNKRGFSVHFGPIASGDEDVFSLERKKTIQGLREKSKEVISAKPAEIMDVNADAVRDAFRRHGVRRLIHGHTHRPARHDIEVDGAKCERWVLPDWYGRGGYLALDDVGPRLVSF